MWDNVKILIDQIECHRELVLLILLSLSSLLLISNKSRLIGLIVVTFFMCLLADHWSCYLLVVAIMLLLTIEKCDSKTMDDLLRLLHAYSGGTKIEPSTQSERAVETMTSLLSEEGINSQKPVEQQVSNQYQDTLDRFKRAQTLEQLAIQYLARIYPLMQSSVRVTSRHGKVFVLDGVVQSQDRDIIIEISCYLSGFGPNHAMITGMYEKAKAYSEALNKQTKFIWMWVTSSKENCKSLEKQRTRVEKIFEDVDFELQIIEGERL